jgi:carbonic anhydrase/acetyltransferase-like protein (isoleucine patch superfamily)
MKPLILPYKGKMPKIADDVFIAPNATIIGDVEIGSQTNIWFNCVIRGDVNTIRIGEHTNIQDGTIIHVTRKTGPTTIGSGVTIGHLALLHACTIEDLSFIGMQATLMDDVVVESGAMVAAGAVVTPNKVIPSGQIWAGNPAKYLRDLREEETDFLKISENNYVELAGEYKELV